MLKVRARSDWTPEYRPESHVPPSADSADTLTERATRVNLNMIMEHVPNTCAPRARLFAAAARCGCPPERCARSSCVRTRAARAWFDVWAGL